MLFHNLLSFAAHSEVNDEVVKSCGEPSECRAICVIGAKMRHKWLSPAKLSTRLPDFKAFEMAVPLKEDASVRPRQFVG